MYSDLVYRPALDSAEVVTLPFRPGQDDAQIQLLGQKFLDAFIGGPGAMVAADPSFKIVRPSDVDIGGPESPETLARAAAYIDQLRRSGKVDRARRNLIKQGIPLGGV